MPHRHAYQGRKLQRPAGQRQALLRGQLTSLAIHERLTTTLAKAKEVAPLFEQLVTKAKQGGLHQRRALRATLLTDQAVLKMTTEIGPTFKDRSGGYTRITKAGLRRGDNAPMAVISLTQEIERSKPKSAVSVKAEQAGPAVKSTAKKPARRSGAKTEAKK